MASRRVLSHPLRSTSLRLLKPPAAFSSPRSSSPAGFPISRPPNPAGGFLFSRAVQYATSADDAASPSAVPSGKITDEFTGAGAVGQNHRYDYNHWLILMDFSEDPEQEPSPVLMIKTYFQTAAEVFGSMEEAKKRIYALSTTTYHGFQCLMDKATSEKFRGLPGVVFIMPDSYIDPVIKEYGGDKCENGHIIPRPPPMQYGDDRGTWSGCYSREFYDERR